MVSAAVRDIPNISRYCATSIRVSVILGKTLGLNENISSYTLRHSWATTAKYTGAPIEMISESLGHKSIKTTQIYLSGFHASALAKVNRKACKYAAN